MDLAAAQKRIAELEEEVWWLKSELGMIRDNTRLGQLSTGLGVPAGVSHLLLALDATYPRIVPESVLYDRIPHKCDGANPDIVGVLVCKARKRIGFDAIETHWGTGFRLSKQGKALIAEHLELKEAA